MLSTTYILSLKNFISEEVLLTRQHAGKEKAARASVYYAMMYRYVAEHVDNFIYFDDSGVDFYKYEFAERVEKIRNKLIMAAASLHIPAEALFVPRIKVPEKTKWQSIIHVQVVSLVNHIYDHDNDEELATMRLFNIENRNSEIAKWIKSKNGKNFLFEFQISEGIRPEAIIKKRLYLFDKNFLYAQMLYMSQQFWVHNVVKEAFNNWQANKKLWNNIDHLKRKITTKELLDESRKEIKFLRLMENNGLKGRFIHDEMISWQVKYRPDFWFVKEDLIVEYDEKAHLSQIEEDVRREKIIRKYLPNIKFIRIQEGLEERGLEKIRRHLTKIDNLQL